MDSTLIWPKRTKTSFISSVYIRSLDTDSIKIFKNLIGLLPQNSANKLSPVPGPVGFTKSSRKHLKKRF